MSLRGSTSYLWDVAKPLGQGATSMVYRGRNKVGTAQVSRKIKATMVAKAMFQ